MTEEQEIVSPLIEVIENCPMGILLLDRGGRICGMNKALEQYLCVNSADLMGKTSTEVPAELAEVIEHVGGPLSFVRADLRERWLNCWSQPINGQATTVAEARYFLDITDIVDLREERDRLGGELAELRPTDPLTGLLNRRALLKALEEQVTRSRRYENPLSVAMMSLARIGSDGATTTASSQPSIVAISRLLKDQLRWADLIALLESSQFSLVLPETSADAATKLTGKITKLLKSLDVVDINDDPVTLVPHFGISAWMKGDDPKRLLRRASEELSAAEADAASSDLVEDIEKNEAKG